MNNLIKNLFSISSAIIISVFVKNILNYNYLYNINDTYILDCMRSE
jgi:hypothetical protein